jgi:hypothetical protein
MLCSNKYENGYIFYYYVFHVYCYCQKPTKCGIGTSGTERLIYPLMKGGEWRHTGERHSQGYGEWDMMSFDGSEPHSNNLFVPILVFLSQIDRLWNNILWQLSVHFRHPWRIKKTNFTRQVITRKLSKINKLNLVCERMLVDSTYIVGWMIDRCSAVT